MFPVRYKLGFYIPEEGIRRSYCLENLRTYIHNISPRSCLPRVEQNGVSRIAWAGHGSCGLRVPLPDRRVLLLLPPATRTAHHSPPAATVSCDLTLRQKGRVLAVVCMRRVELPHELRPDRTHQNPRSAFSSVT
jgi:hypothetical protein